MVGRRCNRGTCERNIEGAKKEGNREWEGQGEREFHMGGYREKAERKGIVCGWKV